MATRTNTTTPKTDVYQIVTDRILAQLDQGVIPWRKPWTGLNVKWEGRKTHTITHTTPMAYSRATGKPYSLLNQMLLGKPGEWASFKQITEAGGRVKKGEKSSICVFWKFLDKPVTNKDGTPVLDADGKPMTEKIPYLRYYNVFHVSTQCEGIEPRKRKVDPTTTTVTVVDDPGHPVTQTDRDWADVEEADEIIREYISRSGVRYTELPDSDIAFYAPYNDSVTVPCRAQFKEGSEFYSTAFHELVHSTGIKSRLNREQFRYDNGESHNFGSDNYSKEELVAEIGAACLNNICEIETPDSFQNSASYIANWSEKFRQDRKLIVSAASKAEKAVAYILGTDATEDTEEQ